MRMSKMPNKNYRRGKVKEYKIVHQLKKDGYIIAQRSAGSKSPIDVFAIHKELKIIKFIQAKPKTMTSLTKDGKIRIPNKRILDKWGWINDGNFKVEFEVI